MFKGVDAVDGSYWCSCAALLLIPLFSCQPLVCLSVWGVVCWMRGNFCRCVFAAWRAASQHSTCCRCRCHLGCMDGAASHVLRSLCYCTVLAWHSTVAQQGYSNGVSRMHLVWVTYEDAAATAGCGAFLLCLLFWVQCRASQVCRPANPGMPRFQRGQDTF